MGQLLGQLLSEKTASLLEIPWHQLSERTDLARQSTSRQWPATTPQ